MHNWKKGFCWVLAGLLATTLLTAVYWHLLDRDFSAFILLSNSNIEQAAFNEEVKIYPHDGYDGQFFYALALNPFERIKAISNPPSENPFAHLLDPGLK